MKRFGNALVSLLMTCACTSFAYAEVVIETVTVGHAGNAGELSGTGAGGLGPNRICGAVGYAYEIGKYEVTTGQYTEFLNAVAATDTHALYNTQMWNHARGCKIERSGSPGSYTYSVASEWADRPVNYVCWGDAARFANWLQNGQPTGPQGPSTTEDGSYALNGATSAAALLAVVRKPTAGWVVPSEDEWHKAAYHKNDGVTGNYWVFPTATDASPSNELTSPDPGNNANFDDGGYTIGTPYFRTDVGDFENSASAYGTFDQGGNVWEWTEAIVHTSYRGFRGGSFFFTRFYLQGNVRDGGYLPSYEDYTYGFRVASVPESVPMASPWGIVVTVLFAVMAGTLVHMRRRPSEGGLCR
ncbi:MAG: SUMF1/EgtB/PvdO family nonheme iron enzyme [Phycisphaerales bacterium]|nr:MAG: SUMF1/EgtB/PvdO family nonheme iron enzyme [Phycisphaerales bacterium]